MKISNYMSKHLVNDLIVLNIIKDDDKENYEYCFDFLFDTLSFILSILLIGLILKKTFQGFLIILALIPTKMLAGGAHANTARMCSIISYTVIFAIFYFTNRPSCIPNQYIILINLIASVAIVYLAPVDHPNKRFHSKQRKKIKKLCIIYMLYINVLFLFFYYNEYIPYFTLIAICDMIIAINQVIGIIINRQRRTP